MTRRLLYSAPVTTSNSAANVYKAKAVALSASCDSGSFIVAIFQGPGDSLFREKMT